MDAVPAKYWKIVLGVGVIMTIFSLMSLPSLYENISGDGIPNRPQKEPPIEYRWDIAISRVTIALISLSISVFAFTRIRIL